MNRSLRPKAGFSFVRWLPLLGLILLAACKREEIKVYYAPKDSSGSPDTTAMQSAPNNMGGTMPGGHPSVDGAQPQLGFRVPDGWTETPAGQMRVASFSVKGADGKTVEVSVVPLPGLAGGDAANVNLWRQQVGMGPATDDELSKQATPVEIDGQPAKLFEQTGKNPSTGEPRGITGAIQYRDDTSWFFKMTGDPDLLAQQKGAFVEFLKSVTFKSGAVPAAGGTTLPFAHPDVAMTPAAPNGPVSHEGQPTWQVPAGWQEVSGGQFLIAKFMITDESGTQAAVNVSASPGDGGGLAANVSRWRGQLGLTPLTPDELKQAVITIEVAGGQGTLIEMSGTDPRTGNPAALSGVMVAQGGQTWFYKLMGPSAIVMAEKDTFLKFVKGVKY